MTDIDQSSRRHRYFPFLLVLAIVFVPAALVSITIGADWLGYCVSDTLLRREGMNAHPYVQNVSSTSATIVWRSTVPHSGRVRVESGDLYHQEIDLPEEELHIAQFDGLDPGTDYMYEVEWEDNFYSASFKTAPGRNGTVTLGVLGDSGTGGGAQYDIAQQLESQDLDAVLHTGDVVYRRGALCHYGGKYFSPYESLIATTPVYPTLGNHDLKAKNGEAYFDTFVLPAASPEYGEAYYSVDIGSVHVSVINSEFYARDDDKAIEAQKSWLIGDLEASDGSWNIVTLHRPLFSSNGGKQHLDIRDDLAPIFEAAGVDIVFAGHAHNYERFEPINGVTYIVTGGGGAKIHGVEPSDSTAAVAEAHHYVNITATSDTLNIHAIGREGDMLDSLLLER